MKTRFALLLATFVFLCAFAGADELWTRAVDFYEAHQELVPGRMEIRFDQYNGRGKLVSAEYSEMAIVVGESGELEARTIFASSNGKDVTEKRQSDGPAAPPFGGSGDDDPGDSPFAALMVSPFAADEQTRVTARNTGRTVMIYGTETQIFEYEHTVNEKSGTVGMVWLDAETGAPLKLTGVMEPMPGFVDQFEMVQEFVTDAEGRWYVSSMQFNGEGNVLFIKRRVESAFSFSDYFDPPAGAVN